MYVMCIVFSTRKVLAGSTFSNMSTVEEVQLYTYLSNQDIQSSIH